MFFRNRLAQSLLVLVVFACSFFSFSVVASAAVLMKAPTTIGLVGYWPFNEGTGSTAYDHSGNGNNGTLTLEEIENKTIAHISIDPVVIGRNLSCAELFCKYLWIGCKSV